MEDNIGENLIGLEFSDDFLDITPKGRSIKEIIEKLDFIQIKAITCFMQLFNKDSDYRRPGGSTSIIS